MSTATPADVKSVISLVKDDGSQTVENSQIQNYLDDAAFEAGQAIGDYNEWDTERQTQLEKYLAALKIRLFWDRSMSMGRRESAQINYEGTSTAELKREVEKRDPSGSLATYRDTDRYVGST